MKSKGYCEGRKSIKSRKRENERVIAEEDKLLQMLSYGKSKLSYSHSIPTSPFTHLLFNPMFFLCY